MVIWDFRQVFNTMIFVNPRRIELLSPVKEQVKHLMQEKKKIDGLHSESLANSVKRWCLLLLTLSIVAISQLCTGVVILLQRLLEVENA